MQLDKIRAIVRPRAPWEAIDLGLVLIQHDALKLYRFWLLLFLPSGLLVYFFLAQWPYLAALVVWLLKPLWDILLLHFFSHALFGEYPAILPSLRAFIHAIFKKGLWLGVFLLRLSLSRSFRLPIWQLENLGFRLRHKRQRLLLKNQMGIARSLSIACFLFEWVIYGSLILLFLFFLPESADYWADEILSATVHDEYADTWAYWLLASFNLLAIAVIEPFYIAGGFSLYLNRRTHLEAWDIELRFRHMGKRLQADM
ncbi:hypothetical protein QUF61_12725 [Candidatus Venteria ishoeyi]|uniref:hypothetical protein n=1 Tax=Candidatus Venteria ishoeyi TaxID=1899563 RepID=UPI0025A5A1FE|nr:hypothetical protein [Candidatus Venteria ishoeyi]MDM8547353.1 hypothetical protein [Candidatus Venteria ishoeyi]